MALDNPPFKGFPCASIHRIAPAVHFVSADSAAVLPPHTQNQLMTTGLVEIKLSSVPPSPLPVRLGKQSTQIRCPHCKTRVLTTVRTRLCGLLSSVHECPQCRQTISLPSGSPASASK